MGDHSNVTLLNSGLYRVTASGSGNTMNTRLIVTGLDVAKTYNIYLACSSELNLNNRWGIGTLAAVPGTTKDILNTAATKTAQTWKPGDNWQVFYNVAPQADGKIYVWGYNLNSSGTNSGITLNGFQVVDATGWQNSDKSIYNFTVAGTPSNYPGVISDHGTGDTITVTMPSTTQPWYSLAPTFTLADGAWCSPASGAATDFSGGPVDYTVTCPSCSARPRIFSPSQPEPHPAGSAEIPSAWWFPTAPRSAPSLLPSPPRPIPPFPRLRASLRISAVRYPTR